MKLSLRVLSEGNATGTAIPITLPQFLIGRDPQCHLRPASPIISKRHCAVLTKNNKAFVRDLGSTNGTYVNDEVIQAERLLTDGDVIKIGPLAFQVHIEEVVAVDKPTPPPKVKQEGGPSNDEDIAAMLLSLQEEGGEAAAAGGDGAPSEEIPSGTTIMDAPALDAAKPPDGAKVAAEAGKEKKDVKGSSATSSSAAAALLAKYARRNRS
jgi:pSer/pThr/pTyr-binding forkhead associated (FHA) protein